MQSCEFCLLIHIWQKERRVQPVKKRISLPMYGAEKDTELTSRGSVASERGEAPHAGETGAFSMVSLTGGSAKTKKTPIRLILHSSTKFLPEVHF